MNASGLCCCLKPCWCPWARDTTGDRIGALACAATEGYNGVQGTYCGRGLCWCPCLYCQGGSCWGLWPVLMLKTTRKFTIHTPVDHQVQGSYFCISINECRLTVEKGEHRRLLWQPLPPILLNTISYSSHRDAQKVLWCIPQCKHSYCIYRLFMKISVFLCK